MTALLSSVKMDWNTPDDVLDLVREVFGRDIGLDPATDPTNPTTATHILTAGGGANGLTEPWTDRGPVFVNPPYGRALAEWAPKIAKEGSLVAEQGEHLIALVPSRTDTRWWQDSIAKAHRVCFWRGRMTFKGAPDPAPFPTALAHWGKGEPFERVFGNRGWLVRP